MVEPANTLTALRAKVARLERGHAAAHEACGGTIPFGEPAIDGALPGGGLARGALHEAAGAGSETEHAASAGRFLAGILARATQPGGWTIWIARDPPYLPALVGCGIDAARLLFACAGSGGDVLQAMEDALHSGALAAVVGELDANFSLTASRRLQLAARASGTLALLLRRSRKFDDPALSNASAAATRWRVGSAPSAPPVASRPGLRGLGPARWRLELLRSRGGGTGSWLVEASDAQGRLRLAADVRDRPVAADWAASRVRRAG